MKPNERIVMSASILLAALMLTGAAAIPAQTLPPASPTAAFAHVTALSQQIGTRLAGTQGDTRGAEYIADQLRQLGYTVQLQAFPFRYFEELQPPSVTVVAPSAEKLNPLTMEYSASTPAGGLEAEVVAVGLGRPEDLNGKRLEGKIALVQRGEIRFTDKVANAAAAGAIAVIIYNHQPGAPQIGTLIDLSRVPAVIIPLDEGQALLRQLGGGPVRVRMLVRTATGQRTSHNVIAIKRGTRSPNEIVVVGGHRDTVHVSPGANDNASGTAAVLEAARLLASTPTARTIHFIGFGAEELGLIGSRFYAQNPPGRIVGMVNMDMVGRGPMQVGNSNEDNTLVEIGERVAQRLGIRVSRFKLRGAASDHFNFEAIGVPTLFIHTGDDPAIHTPNDTADRVDPALIAQAASIAAAAALQVAEAGR